MFESLTDRLSDVFSRLRGKGKLSEEDVETGLREIRRAFLEADVNLKVTRTLIDHIREKAIGSEILTSLTPDQMLVKIVNDEIVELLGSDVHPVRYASQPPTVIVMVGLQGSGKTTTTAKLASLIRKEGHRPLLVGVDVHRPAAGEQLAKLGKEIDVPVAVPEAGESAVQVATRGLGSARQYNCDVVLVDTAGRLQIDEEMLGELQNVIAALPVFEKILVIDSMTGQEGVNVGQGFHEAVGIDGAIMTKLDGDARGGAALSLRAAIGVPIMYCGTGERIRDLEVFDPSRMASRIVGMGDVLSLIERAQETMDQKEAEEASKRLLEGTFTFDDWLSQMRSMRQVGSIENILGMLPGGRKMLKQVGQSLPSEAELSHMEAIVLSMTRHERARPEAIDGKRKKRIALGSGTAVSDVNRLLKNFEQARSLAKMLGGGGKGGKNLRKAMKMLGNSSDMKGLLGNGPMQ